jgi:hypothetical protein
VLSNPIRRAVSDLVSSCREKLAVRCHFIFLYLVVLFDAGVELADGCVAFCDEGDKRFSSLSVKFG